MNGVTSCTELTQHSTCIDHTPSNIATRIQQGCVYNVVFIIFKSINVLTDKEQLT